MRFLNDLKERGTAFFERIVSVNMTDEEDLRLGRLFNTLMIISIGYCITLSLVFVAIWALELDVPLKSKLGAFFPMGSIPISACCMWLAKRRLLRFAIFLYVWSNCIAIFIAIFLYEGVDAPGAWLLLSWTIVISGALLSPGEALKMTGLVVLYFFLLLILKNMGVYAPPLSFVGPALTFKDMTFTLAVLVFSICILTYLNMKSLKEALTNLYRTKKDLDNDRLRLEQKTRELENEIQMRMALEQEKEKIQRNLLQAEKMEAIGSLAGGVAHDFNNLLMAIQGRTSLLLMNRDPDDPMKEHLKEIEEYIESAATLTRQLLGFARRGKYDVVPTDLNELTRHQVWMFGRTHKKIIIHETYAEDLWPVEVDRSQIGQVLLNIFLNADQAMPDGGNLFIQTRNMVLAKEMIESFRLKSEKFVELTIRDTGVGMDEEIRQNIFHPFFTTKERGRGTGLGLASAYGIIQNHGGCIVVDSAVGKGASFSLFLPSSSTCLTAADRNIRKTEDASEKIVRGTEKILLVDDEQMIIEVGELMLTELGYDVITASGGEEALRIYKEKGEEISLVIIDLIMPGMDGGTTFDRIREINPNAVVLLSSGYSMDGQAEKVLQRGCNGFIQKPYRMMDLSVKIRETIASPLGSRRKTP